MKKIFLIILLFAGVLYSQDGQPDRLIRRTEASTMIADSLNIVRASVATKLNTTQLTDTLNANIRGYQTLPQIKAVVSDSLNPVRASVATKLNTTQLTDTLNANIRGYQNIVQVKAVVSDSVSQKLNRDFSILPQIPSTDLPNGANRIPVQTEDGSTVGNMNLEQLPVSNPTYQEITNAISGITTSINNIEASIQSLSDRVGVIEDRLGVPTNPVVLPPTGVTAVAGTRQITIGWTNPTAGTFDSLWLYKNTTLTGTYTKKATLGITDVSYTDVGLADNTTYYYYLISYKGTNYSSISTIVNATTNSVTSELFAIQMNAETGNTSQFTSVVVDSTNQLYASDTSIVIHGLYSYIAKDNHYTADMTFGNRTFTAADSVYARYYIYIPSTFKSISGNSFTILGFFNGSTELISFQVASTTNAYTHKLMLFNGSTNVNLLTTLPKNQIICLELFYKKGTGSNGVVRAYVNNTLAYSTAAATGTLTAGRIYAGIFSYGTRVDIGSYYIFDDVIVNNSYIGLFGGSSSGGGGTPTNNAVKYIAPSSLGGGTGVDSANALGFNSFDLNSLTPGDTLLFTKGVYNADVTKTITTDGTAAKPITFMGTYPYGAVFTGSGQAFTLAGANYIRFKFLKFQNLVRGIRISNANVVYIDSCYATKFSEQGGFVGIYGSVGSTTAIDSVFLRYNTAINDTQTYTQADLIYAQYAGNIFIIKNYLVNKDTIDVSQHIDCIQTANNMGTVIITGNKIENYKKESSQGMMLSIPQSGEEVLYNNAVYVPSNAKGISSSWYSTSAAKVYYLNNTAYNRSTVLGWVGITSEFFGRNGTVSFNNVSFNDGTPTTSNVFTAVLYEYPVIWGDSIDYNLYWTNYCPSPVGHPSAGSYFSVTANNITTGTSSLWSLSQWQGSTNNPDLHSLQSNPLFTNKMTGDLTLQSTSPAKNTGKNISSLISYFGNKYPNCGFEWKTITGIARDTTPDMGAY